MKAPQIAVLLTASISALSFQAAWADHTADSASVVSRTGSAKADSNGRQIAAVLPVMAAPKTAPKGIVPIKSINHPSDTASTRWRKVTFAVPTSVGEAADFCGTTANKAGKVAAAKFLETASWTHAYVKQMGKTPLITPAAEIARPAPKVVQPVAFHHKSWYMSDGRVKTLTQR